jgi:hypothetical protein
VRARAEPSDRARLEAGRRADRETGRVASPWVGRPVRIVRPLAPGAPAELRALKEVLAGRLGDRPRPLAERVEVLAEVSRRWTDPADPYRRAGLRALAREAGYAPSTAAAGLDATFCPWTLAAWRELARRELGQASPRGPGVVPHVLGGSLPGPNLLPLFFTLLVGGAPVARAGRRIPSFPALALASVAAVDPALGDLAAICRWPRARADLTRALFEGARVGSVTGGDRAVAEVRALAGPGTRLLTHPHKVSFAYLGAGAVASPAAAAGTAARLARDVALHDQQGCLSPVGVLVAAAGNSRLEAFARALAAALEERERTWPRARPAVREAAAIRAFHDAFVLAGEREGRPRVFAGGGLAWVVGAVAAGELPPASPLFRCVWVGSVGGAPEALRLLARWRGATAAVGFRGSSAEREGARVLARELGASRLCPLGRMQSPPLAWRQDGARPLRAFLE